MMLWKTVRAKLAGASHQTPAGETNASKKRSRKVRGLSLGTGIIPANGDIHFVPNSKHFQDFSEWSCSGNTASTTDEADECENEIELRRSITIMTGLLGSTTSRNSSVFVKVTDLCLEGGISTADLPISKSHGAKVHGTNEKWMGLDMQTEDGFYAEPSPNASVVAEALSAHGIQRALDESLWTPDRKTGKLLRQHDGGILQLPKVNPYCQSDKEVLIWTRTVENGLPSVRSRGIVAMSPRALVDLLMDSNRVSIYNKISLGRTDELLLSDTLDADGVTKVVRSRSKPPLIHTIVELVTLMHARKLRPSDGCGAGYVIVSRGVTKLEHSDVGKHCNNGSEIVLNVNIIRYLDDDDGKCEMININHIKSPGVPLMIARRIGLAGAASFINDIRSVC